MKHTFEVFLTGDQLSDKDWRNFYASFNSYSGLIGKMRIIFQIKENVIRIYMQSNKDLSNISNKLTGMVLKELNDADIDIPVHTKRDRLMSLVAGGSIIDFKEKHAVKKGKDLETAVIDISAINTDKALVKAKFYFKNPGNQYSMQSKIFATFPYHLFAVKFGDDSTYMKKKIDKYLDIEKSLQLLTSDENLSLFKVDGFPYLKGEYYINLHNYEFEKHSFIVGASGSGKSKLISLLIDRIGQSQLRDQYRVVVVDPHNALKDDLEHVVGSNIVGFGSDSVELFNDSPSDIQAETELTTLLMKSLMGEQYNPRLERVLKYSLYTLFTAKSMSLDNLKRFLTDTDLRNQIVEHVQGYVPDNVTRFFGADYNEIKTQYYTQAVLPIISLVDEMSLQPAMMSDGNANLGGMVRDNFLTVFSLNKVSMGEKVVKTVAGLIIQQIFLQAQSGAFGGKKVMLIIDEVSVVQNPALSQILAEARKFGLSVVLTQQYFGQIEKELQDAIFANVYNYYVFKVSEEDARALEGNLSIELPKSVVAEEEGKRLSESDIRVKILTELSPRECLVRLSASGKIHPCIKARTVDIADRKKEVTREDILLEKYDKQELPDKFVEGKTPELQTNSPPVATMEAPVVAQTPHYEDVQAEEIKPISRTTFNLSDLLREQSSSRKLVNKKKKDQ